ncbi:recombination regulator RecX [Staphylococcus sp. 17KM0847]|uniref:recombination regulator RecX n=1 Tax=Staphylococcus sp. 17KM0847 TaxID=2583989 RepID=UPI0015DC57F0|nr:recombination regulator RecX [Staphylococcus sp. 17KM0847]QLK86373.1 recombination regulator RecX [Staphylococcus sp. 17KM0847]
MPQISKIEVQKNNNERFNIYIDDVFAIGVSIDTLVHFNLKKGDEVNRERLGEIEAREFQQQAINQAIHYLSYRKRTRHEIRQHLIKKEYPDTIIEQALEYCERLKLIDHVDYMESLKNTMIRTTDKGPEIFRKKLQQAGIEKELIERGVACYIDEQPIEKIYALAEKILRQKKGPAVKVRQQVQQALMNKGYTLDVIMHVVETLNFEPEPEIIDSLLQRDLEKFFNKYHNKYEGRQLRARLVEVLMRKGYTYDDIQQKLVESGIENE